MHAITRPRGESDSSEVTLISPVSPSFSPFGPNSPFHQRRERTYDLDIATAKLGARNSIFDLPSAKFEPTMGAFSTTLYIVNSIIGAGVFAVGGSILAEVGSPGAALSLWILGGVAAILAGLSYVEWGLLFPFASGGDQFYLFKAFPKPRALVAFLYSFAMVFVGKPGYTAAMSTVCIVSYFPVEHLFISSSSHGPDHPVRMYLGEMKRSPEWPSLTLITIFFYCTKSATKYLMFAIFGVPGQDLIPDAIENNWQAITKTIALVVTTSITALNLFSNKATVKIQNVLSLIKIALLLTFCVAGVLAWTGILGHVKPTKTLTPANLFQNTTANPGGLATALFKIFYALDGFSYANSVSSDVKQPSKILPKAIILGVGGCSIAFLLLNTVYFAVIPLDELLASGELLGGVFAVKIFGEFIGQKVVPALIALCALGACLAVVFSAPRISVTAAELGVIPGKLGSKLVVLHHKLKTPVNALMLNWVIAAMMVAAPPGKSAFSFLVDLATYPAWLFYGLSMAGLLYYRKISPDVQRPFRVWAVGPIVVMIVSAFLAVMPFLSDDSWLSSLVSVVLLALGVPIFFLSRRFVPTSDMMKS